MFYISKAEPSNKVQNTPNLKRNATLQRQFQQQMLHMYYVHTYVHMHYWTMDTMYTCILQHYIFKGSKLSVQERGHVELNNLNVTLKYTHRFWFIPNTHLLCAPLDDIRGEVGELFEEGVLTPHGLGGHLGQLHGRQGWGKPAVATQNIYTRLDQPDCL